MIVKEQRQCKHKAKADQKQKHQKQAATHDAYRAANQLRMAARRALGWIGKFQKVLLVFRYEISDFSYLDVPFS